HGPGLAGPPHEPTCPRRPRLRNFFGRWEPPSGKTPYQRFRWIPVLSGSHARPIIGLLIMMTVRASRRRQRCHSVHYGFRLPALGPSTALILQGSFSAVRWHGPCCDQGGEAGPWVRHLPRG